MANKDARIFVRDREKWDFCFNESHLLKDRAEVRVVEKGILLPLVPVPEDELPRPVLNMVCRGGVCDANGAFVAGHVRDHAVEVANLECREAYPVQAGGIIRRHENVVFGGVLYEHFGLALTDSLSRLWYAADHDFEKLVFLRFPHYERTISFDALELVRLMGIPEDKIEVIEKPTRFDQVIVPDEAFISFSGYLPEFKKPFAKISQNVAKEDTPKKIYLSRMAFQEQEAIERPRCIINERYYESFFGRRGYEAVCPEQLPLEEQIALIHGADEIVATIGTLTHMLLFARDDVTATILLRDTPLLIQSNVDQACGIQPYYVDAVSNPLPVDHEHGPYLMVPNRYFKQYLDARGIAYEQEELDWEPDKDCLIMDFLRQWSAMYRQPHAAGHYIAEESMFDVIRRMNDALYDSTFDERAYEDAGRLKTTASERDELEIQLQAARQELEDLRASTSWKLTAPIRNARDLAASIRKK